MAPMIHDDDIADIEQRLGYYFEERGWLRLALTHSSVGAENNEVLAWLGDRIHGVWVARQLVARRQGATKGWLTDAAKGIVDGTAQAAAFDRLELEAHIQLGGSVTGAGRWVTASMKSTAFEAIVGAIEGDFFGRAVPVEEGAEAFLRRQFDELIAGIVSR